MKDSTNYEQLQQRNNIMITKEQNYVLLAVPVPKNYINACFYCTHQMITHLKGYDEKKKLFELGECDKVNCKDECQGYLDMGEA